MFKIGLIINPIAGIGGKVGLKGSDGEAILQRALELGAVPESNAKAMATLQALKPARDDIEFYAYPSEMGGDILRVSGFHANIIGRIEEGFSRPADTVNAARAMLQAGVELILFAGGDGTARNILDAVGTDVPVLGIPTGCKIHSAVYALNPKRAGELALQCVKGTVREFREAEVMDIDEELFRQGTVQARLYGYLKVPNERDFVQCMKSGRGPTGPASIAGMAAFVAETMEADTLTIVGPGSTTRAVMEKLGLPNTLLGVDLVCNGMLLKSDAAEKDILAAIDIHKKAKIIVTVIGGQGYVFGRGNQQISSEVLRRVGRENIMIVASREKMTSLAAQGLYVDTGMEETDESLCGYHKVVVGYQEYVMARLVH
jgi:predicted polyphosphate/ATP-dependent NAD kinase